MRNFSSAAGNATESGFWSTGGPPEGSALYPPQLVSSSLCLLLRHEAGAGVLEPME